MKQRVAIKVLTNIDPKTGYYRVRYRNSTRQRAYNHPVNTKTRRFIECMNKAFNATTLQWVDSPGPVVFRKLVY